MTTTQVIVDPTTGEPMLRVCTTAPLTPEEVTTLQAMQLSRQKASLTDAQQIWLDGILDKP